MKNLITNSTPHVGGAHQNEELFELFRPDATETAQISKLVQKIITARKMKQCLSKWIDPPTFVLNYLKVDFDSNWKKITICIQKIKEEKFIAKYLDKTQLSVDSKAVQETEGLGSNPDIYSFEELSEMDKKEIYEIGENKKLSQKMKNSIPFLSKTNIIKLFYQWKSFFNTIMVLSYVNLFLHDFLKKSEEAYKESLFLLEKNLEFFVLNYFALKTMKSFVKELEPKHSLVTKLVNFVRNSHRELAFDSQFASLGTFLAKLLGYDNFSQILEFVESTPEVLKEKNKVKKFYIALILEKNDKQLLEKLYRDLRDEIPMLTKSLHGHKLVHKMLEQETDDCRDVIINLALQNFPRYFSLKNSATLLLPLLIEDSNLAKFFSRKMMETSFISKANEMIEVLKSESGTNLILYILAAQPEQSVYSNLISFILSNISVLAKSSYTHELLISLKRIWTAASSSAKDEDSFEKGWIPLTIE